MSLGARLGALRATLGLLAVLAIGGCALPVGRDFTRPTPTTLRPGQSSLEDVKRLYGEPRSQQAWSRTQGVLQTQGLPAPTPFPAAAVGGTVREMYYTYLWSLGDAATSGVKPSKALRVWLWNGKLVAYRAVSSFRADATGFDEGKVGKIEAWKSLRSDVIAALGEPSGLAVYPMVRDDDVQVLIYQGHEFDTGKNETRSQALYVLVNALGIVEDVRLESGSRPIPPPVVTPAPSVPIYIPPPTRKH